MRLSQMTVVDKAVRYLLIMEAPEYARGLEEIEIGIVGGYGTLQQYTRAIAARDRLIAEAQSGARPPAVGSRRRGAVILPSTPVSESEPSSVAD